MLCLILAKVYSIVVKAVFINLFDILPKNKVVKPSIRPDIRPDIRYPAFELAGYPAKNSIRCIPSKKYH
jgi:hypothetical protein